jgi:hypothetical protein
VCARSIFALANIGHGGKKLGLHVVPCDYLAPQLACPLDHRVALTVRGMLACSRNIKS